MAWYAFAVLYCGLVLGWLLLGLIVAFSKHPPAPICLTA